MRQLRALFNYHLQFRHTRSQFHLLGNLPLLLARRLLLRSAARALDRGRGLVLELTEEGRRRLDRGLALVLLDPGQVALLLLPLQILEHLLLGVLVAQARVQLVHQLLALVRLLLDFSLVQFLLPPLAFPIGVLPLRGAEQFAWTETSERGR